MRAIDGDALLTFIDMLKKVCTETVLEQEPQDIPLSTAFAKIQCRTLDIVAQQISLMPTFTQEVQNLMKQPPTRRN